MTIRVFLGALLLATTLAVSAQDITPPVITPNVSGTVGLSGWFLSDVSLTWTVTDDESAIQSSIGCEPLFLTQDDTMRDYTCIATSAGGTTVVSYPIGRDTMPPVVSYLGNAGTYTLDQVVSIFCNVADITSGVEETDCVAIVGEASSFNIGENVFTSTATDFAGHTGTGVASFTVIVDVAGLSAIIDQVVLKESLARNLQRKLEAGQIDQFIRTVERESGRNIAPADAERLLYLVSLL